MSVKTAILVLASLSLATPLCAQTEPAPAPAAPEQAKAKKPRKICHEVGATGTRFTRTVCRTADEWAALQSNTQNGSDRNYTDYRQGYQ
jgi:hypothetical protein